MTISDRFAGTIGLSIGALGLVSLGVQPQLLDASLAFGISTDAAGMLSTVEIAAMAFAAACGFPLLGGKYRRPTLVAGAVATIVAYLALPHAAGLAACLCLRAAAGAGEGLLATMGIVSILGSAAPVRSGALFIGLTAMPQLVATGMIGSGGLGPHPATPFPILAGFGALALLLALPGRTTAASAPARPAMPTPRAAAAIGLMMVLNMIGSACWTYLDAWNHVALPGDALAAFAIPLCLAAQIGASLLVAWRGPSRGIAAGLAVVMLGEAFAIREIGHAASGERFLIAVSLFGFAWQAALPLATGLFLRADPSLGAASLVLPMSLAGVAAGPALASLLAAGRLGAIFDLSSLALVLAATALACLDIANRHRPRRAYS